MVVKQRPLSNGRYEVGRR